MPFTEHEIDLRNKPEWYLTDVNPAGLGMLCAFNKPECDSYRCPSVPAITYGGPEVPADHPSSESIKLRESFLIIEWIADEFPQSNLLPKAALERYKARLVIDVVTSKMVPALNAFVFRDGTSEALLKGVELVQKELVPNVKYAISDEFTIADAASAPFISRLRVFLKNGLNASNEPERGKSLYDLISQDPRFSRFWNYSQALLDRSSVKEIYNEVRA